MAIIQGFLVADQLSASQGDGHLMKVLVRLKVPGLKGLTEQSRHYKAIRPGKSFDANGHQADENLKEAIQRVSEKVIKELRSTEFKVNRTYSTLPLLAMDVDQEAYNLLYNLKEVENVIEDRLIPRMADPTTPNEIPKTGSAGDLSSTMLDDTPYIIGADNAWGLGLTGEDWYVAVIDCGLRTTHELFDNKTIIEKCYSIWNHCPNNQSEMTGTGAAAQHPSSYLYYDHGTKVTSVAVGDDGDSAPAETIYGIAKKADIIAVKVCSRYEGDCDPNTAGTQPCASDQISDTISGLEYIYTIRGSYSIAAVNVSLGYTSYTSTEQTEMQDAIDNLYAVGIPTIVASGNNNSCSSLTFPASYANTISVGATTKYDDRWVSTSTLGSNHNSTQDLYAPGANIRTAEGGYDGDYSAGNYGTSVAAPHVSGAWAILKQAWPEGSIANILTALTSTGTSISAGCTGGVTKPRINVDDAIYALPIINTTSPWSYASVERGDNVYISWTTSSWITGNVSISAISGTTPYTISSSYPTNSGTYTNYTWTVPNDFPLNSQTKIRVQQGSFYGDSDTFAIGQLSITSPTSSQIWYHNSSHTVTWSSTGVSGVVNLYLKVTSGVPDPRIAKTSDGGQLSSVKLPSQYTIVSSISVGTGTYTWTVPTNIPEGTYTVNVQQSGILGTGSGYIFIRE